MGLAKEVYCARTHYRGSGFPGFSPLRSFIAEGHSVVGMDNLITGNTRNLAHLAGNPQFHFIRHDVTNYIYVDGPLDAVLHFASPASPIDYLKFPIQTLKVGSLGTHNTLGLAKAKGARYLLASTSEIYGDPLEHPQKESYAGNVDTIGRAAYTTRPSASPKRSQWPITEPTGWTRGSCVSSTRMVHGCALMMAASCRTSSGRRCDANR